MMVGGKPSAPGAAADEDQVYRPQPRRPIMSRNDSIFLRSKMITGAIQTIGHGLTNITEQIPGFKMISTESKKAIKAFDLLQKDIEKVLVNNPRFPVAEVKRVQDMIKRGSFVSQDTFEAALQTLDEDLAIRIPEQLAIANDTTMPADMIKDSLGFLQAAYALRRRLGVPPTINQDDPASMDYWESLPSGSIVVNGATGKKIIKP